jgi:hypothetical protein
MDSGLPISQFFKQIWPKKNRVTQLSCTKLRAMLFFLHFGHTEIPRPPTNLSAVSWPNLYQKTGLV